MQRIYKQDLLSEDVKPVGAYVTGAMRTYLSMGPGADDMGEEKCPMLPSHFGGSYDIHAHMP